MGSGVGRLTIEVLGPLRALSQTGEDRTPSGTLQRRLLALLVLRRGHTVSADAAIDALWPTKRPADPVASLQNHLFRLRQSLPDGVIQSVNDGYRLDPLAVDVDVDRLAVLLSTAPSGPVDDALGRLIARWHGPAYPELVDLDDGRLEAARLEELRIEAREAQAEVRLADGATDGIVAELIALVDEVPLRERPRALLMEALASTGRRAEALRVYDHFRRLLGDELGIEPSAALTERHDGLLTGTTGPAGNAPHRLPVALTALIGREPLVTDALTALEGDRLVTLVGPGGVGKTRVLGELGRRLVAARPERPVAMCELATADPRTAVVTVARSLGIDDRPGVPIDERVVDVVSDSEFVVLLDNCEHVLDVVAPFVERLLSSCPGTTVVTTTRERLRLPGERLLTVPPLASEGVDSPAAQLFVDRSAAAAGAEATAARPDLVVEIVRRLDGLPLAIELAAARLHTHDLEEVAAGLDGRFALLTTGSRSSTRHSSLMAAVSWSFDLLSPALQDVLAAVSIHSGPFDSADAAAVADIAEPDADRALAELVERSLAMRAPGGRHVLLETLRAFGAEVLERTGRARDVAARHAAHQVTLAECADRRMIERGAAALAEIDDGTREAHRALGWLLDHDEVEAAARIVIGLCEFGFFRLRPDVLAWSERVLDADRADASVHAPDLWATAAYAAWMAGDLDETATRARRAADLSEQRGGSPSALVMSAVGSWRLFDGDLTLAADWFRRSAEVPDDWQFSNLQSAGAHVLALAYADDHRARAAADDLLERIGHTETAHAAYAWYSAGEVEMGRDPERARAHHARAIALAEATGATIVTGLAGASKASIDAKIADPDDAAAQYRQLIDHWRRAGMWSTQWTMLRSVAVLLGRLGRHREAAVLEGAVRAPHAGHRVFGADAVALDELSVRLRSALGDDRYEAARDEGAALDGASAVEHALTSL